MAKFAKEGKIIEKDAEPNSEAIKQLGLTILMVEKSTGKEFKINNENAISVRFKERKGKLFARIKGESGIIISIPNEKLPEFIQVDIKKKDIW